MTYKELLAKINEEIKLSSNSNAYGEYHADNFLNALRAVVELHKPHTVWVNFEGTPIQDCDHCGQLNSAEDVPYPCPTIQAIEKELNG